MNSKMVFKILGLIALLGAIFSLSRIVEFDQVVEQKQTIDSEQNVFVEEEGSQQECSDDADGTEGDLEDDACACSYLGDMNEDNEINARDLQLIINMVLDGIYDSKGDLNDDCEVNVRDFQLATNAVLDGVTCPCKDYMNEEKGYSLEYPHVWELNDTDPNHVIITNYQTVPMESDNVKMKIDIFNNELEKTLSEWIEENERTFYQNRQRIEIDGFEAEKEIFAAGPNLAYVVYILKGEQIYRIIYTLTAFSSEEALDELQEIYNQIISSFDFTE